jgi:hypothetical protein
MRTLVTYRNKVNITPVVPALPLPASLPMLTAALALLGVIVRMQRRSSATPGWNSTSPVRAAKRWIMGGPLRGLTAAPVSRDAGSVNTA